MDLKSSTLVTALFDIGRPIWPHYDLPEERYLGWLRNTVSLKSNLIVFADKHFYARVKAMCDELNPNAQILYVESVEALHAYKHFYSPLNRLMNSIEFHRSCPFPVPEATQPLYNILMFNKIPFIMRAAAQSKFDPEAFYWWVDAGGLRESIDNYKDKSWPRMDKINVLPEDKCVFFSHHEKINILNARDHSFSQMRYIQGTAFGGRLSALHQLWVKVAEKIDSCIIQGFIGSDEKIFDLVYLDNPELFQLEVSTWRQYYERFS